jgi:hypothetical protein
MSRDASTVFTMVGHRFVDVGNPRDVDDDHAGPVRADRPQELVGELVGPLLVEHSDDREDQQAFAHLQHRRGQLAQRVLLLADDPLALLDEAARHGVRDPVRRGLVGVEHAVEHLEVVAVLLEERPREDVAEQEDDADHLVRLDAAGDDPLGQVAGVVAQLVDAAGLQHGDVVVVDRRDLAEHLLGGHRRQQVLLVDPRRPLLTERPAMRPEVGDELREQRRVLLVGVILVDFLLRRHLSRHVLPSSSSASLTAAT